MANIERAAATGEPPRTRSYTEVEGDDTVVWLEGEHDGATLDELSKSLAEAIALTRSAVIVDLSGVEFMGAATIGALMRARHFLEARSRRLVLRAPSVSAQRILDVCGIDLIGADGVVILGAARALESFVPVPAVAPVPPVEAPAAAPRARSDYASQPLAGEPVSRGG